MHVRRTLAVGALSAMAFTGLVGPAANADGHLDCATIEQSIDAAKQDVKTARLAFKASNRPMGKLIKVERTEARAEARQSARALKSVSTQIREASGPERRQLAQQRRTERQELAKAHRLLESKRALLNQIKLERRSAREDFKAARAVLREARQFKESCEAAEPTTDDSTGTDTTTGSTDTGTGSTDTTTGTGTQS